VTVVTGGEGTSHYQPQGDSLDVLRHCECEGWIGRWPYHGRNDPEGTFRCSDCERVLEEQYVRADLHRGAVDRVRALRIIGPEHYDREEAARIESWNGAINAALAAVRGQSSSAGCSACSPDLKTARPPHTCMRGAVMTATERAMCTEENDELARLRNILDGCDDAALERAARALHDREPWVYGQDAGGEDVTKPWDEAAESVRESYLKDALVALRAAGETRGASDEEGRTDD
jgi:hypothetical protein